MLLGLLEAFLLGLTRLLLALHLEVVSCALVAVVPAEDAKRSGEQSAQGATPGTSRTEGSGQSIEPGVVHEGTP
jgi:hypothetical protein